MIAPMTEEEIKAVVNDTKYSIVKVREAAQDLDQIEAILKEHRDLTRFEALLSVCLRKNPAPRI